MHELSIASALVEQVNRHTPAGMAPRQVRVRTGPLRCLDPDAMQFAWQAATMGSRCEGAQLQLQMLDQGDELTLVSLDVEEVLPCK